MRNNIVLAFLFSSFISFAQSENNTNSQLKKGFTFGLGLGAGALQLKIKDTSKVNLSLSVPNIKVGIILNEKTQVFLLLHGSVYNYNNKDRGFEACLLGAQYWLQPNWWINAGAGLTFDAAAFYTVKDPKTADFYTGFPALTASTGYEIWHKGRFALDLQYRIFAGQSNLPENLHRKGIANIVLIGFNWY